MNERLTCHDIRIYVELAEQYALMDASSNVAKRNVLAEHLREIIDTIEQKVRQLHSMIIHYRALIVDIY